MAFGVVWLAGGLDELDPRHVAFGVVWLAGGLDVSVDSVPFGVVELGEVRFGLFGHVGSLLGGVVDGDAMVNRFGVRDCGQADLWCVCRPTQQVGVSATEVTTWRVDALSYEDDQGLWEVVWSLSTDSSPSSPEKVALARQVVFALLREGRLTLRTAPWPKSADEGRVLPMMRLRRSQTTTHRGSILRTLASSSSG
jgi:hypothetical protein